jgi:RNA polymerase sigma-70 factor (ECF subfamily)
VRFESLTFKTNNLQATLTAATDEQILVLLQQPDSREQGFRLLMSVYQERLYWHIRKMVGTHNDTDDVLQNCLIKVFRNIHRFEGKSQLYTWLYRIATNEALTFLKKAQRRATDSIEGHAAVFQLQAEASVDGEKLLQKLDAAIGALPEKQKLVFRLRYYEEMSYKDMSVRLQTSEGALKASYHHAVRKVEAALKEGL